MAKRSTKESVMTIMYTLINSIFNVGESTERKKRIKKSVCAFGPPCLILSIGGQFRAEVIVLSSINN